MKFRAKVNVLGEEGERNAAYLVKAFFENYNTESSIYIKDGVAILEIYFEKENLPIAIIDAIGYCKLKDFEYNKKLQELGQKENFEQEQKTSEQTKMVVNEHPELTEIAKKCSSYEEFVNKLTKGIDFGKKNEFFVKLVNAALQTEDIKWDNIKEVFKNNNLEYSESNKVFCTARVTEKFSRSRNPVKILELIKIIVTYQAFDFHKENEEHEDKNHEKE